MLFHWRLLCHNLLLYDLSHLYFSKKMCWTSGLFRCKLSAARGENWNMLVAAAFRGGLVHFLAFLCEALLCGRQHAIYNQVHAQASMRYSAAARDLVGWLMQSGLPSKSPQSHSWRKPAWWRSPSTRKVWERFGPCIRGIKGKRCYNCLSSEWWNTLCAPDMATEIGVSNSSCGRCGTAWTHASRIPYSMVQDTRWCHRW